MIPPPYAGYIFLAYVVAVGWIAGYSVYFNRSGWVFVLFVLLVLGIGPVLLLLSPR